MSKKKIKQAPVVPVRASSPKIQFKDYQKNIIAFLGVFIILLIVLSPMAFKGLRPGGVDVIGSKGASHQRAEYEKETGEMALWNSPVFSGMPIYHRLGGKVFSADTFITRILGKILYLNIWMYLIGFMGMFFLLRQLKISYFAAVFGALAFMFIPHYMSLLSIGHFQKFRPIMFMPFVTYFFIAFLNRKHLLYLIGFIIALSVQIRTLHFQVVFYQILVLLFIGCFYLAQMLIKKQYKLFGLKMVLLFAAGLIVIMMVAQPVFVVGEYTPYSIRGGTGEEGTTGLTSDYATSWSFEPSAMLCWIMPRFLGGTSGEIYNGSRVSQFQGKQIPGYWGQMPFTQAYDYIGIVLFFMALLGLIMNFDKGLIKVLSGLFILALFLSFGRHFPLIYNFFFKYIPAFNKFRVPAMIQVVMHLMIVIFAGFGFDSILKNRDNKNFVKIVLIVGIFLLILGSIPYIFGNSFSLLKDGDSTQYKPDVLQLIKLARLDMMQTDGLRTILFTVLTAVVLFLFLKKKIRSIVLITCLLILLFADQVPYVKKAEGDLIDPEILEKQHFNVTAMDKVLDRDKSYFRIFPVTENPFNSNDWSYYHNSIGGYSGAKLRIYQDIIENCIFKGTDPQFPVNWNILKMLNTKYLISSQQLPGQFLKFHYEDKKSKLLAYSLKEEVKPAWFVGDYKIVPDREERFVTLNNSDFDVYQTAILEEEPGFEISSPDSSSVEVLEASFNKIKYKIFNDKPALFVASEVYYPAADCWKCYIDEQEQDILKTNHILRSVFIKTAGEHEVTFEFAPETFFKYYRLSMVGHLFVLICLLGLIGFSIIRKKRNLEK